MFGRATITLGIGPHFQLWSPYVIGQTIIFLPCDFFLSIFFFFYSSPNLSGHRLDVYHTATHDVVLVRIQNASLKCAARGLLKVRDPKMTQKAPSGHHLTTLSGHIFATKARIDNGKNLLHSNISSRCPHNMVNFRLLAAEIGPVVWGTPANFNGFRVLAALLHDSQVVSVSKTLRR